MIKKMLFDTWSQIKCLINNCVWCKGVQCSVVSELKQIKISSLKCWIVTFEMEISFVKPYLCAHHVPNHSNMRL
jgi:hypothetical protein